MVYTKCCDIRPAAMLVYDVYVLTVIIYDRRKWVAYKGVGMCGGGGGCWGSYALAGLGQNGIKCARMLNHFMGVVEGDGVLNYFWVLGTEWSNICLRRMRKGKDKHGTGIKWEWKK